ncbi:MAG: hypothetical protein MUQ20_02125, partial [Deltaproteobacteria bacterium]|nr:hypothetical protein [Deltaproteobacteria bacterium]
SYYLKGRGSGTIAAHHGRRLIFPGIDFYLPQTNQTTADKTDKPLIASAIRVFPLRMSTKGKNQVCSCLCEFVAKNQLPFKGLMPLREKLDDRDRAI